MSGEVRIGRLDASLLDTMLDWAAAEGWNPGVGDAEVFLATIPRVSWGCSWTTDLQ
jgi:hypothetical protein